LKSARRTSLGDFRDTAGQTVSDRLGVNKCAAIIELCVICIHVRMDAVLFRHSCKILGVCSETKGPKNGPLGYTACDRKTVCGIAGIDK